MTTLNLNTEKILSNSKPKVSIICITYGHEKYIAQTINGFLMQRTDFSFEILIGEDCSPDNSRAIIKEYAENSNNIIPILRTKNIGSLPNLLDLLSRAKGEYVAICDGDDYWTDESKLQKQVDFLDKNIDFSMCCHNVKVLFEDDSQPAKISCPLDYLSENVRKKGYLEFEDFFPINPVSSLSVMYRWDQNYVLPGWMASYKIGDLPLHLIHANKGKVGVINETMGVYRRHSESVWFYHDTEEHRIKTSENYIQLLNNINIELGFQYNKILKKAIRKIKIINIINKFIIGRILFFLYREIKHAILYQYKKRIRSFIPAVFKRRKINISVMIDE